MKKMLFKGFSIIWAMAAVLSAFAQAQEKEPINYNNEGVEQIKSGNYGRAIELFDQALRLKPDYATAFYNRGTAFYYAGKLPEAVASLQAAVKFDPNYPEAFNQLGVIFTSMLQYEKAVGAFKNSIRENPHGFTAYYNIGAVYIRLHKFGAAIESLEKAKCLEYGNTEILINLSFAYAQRRNYFKALELVNEAVNFKPGDAQAHALLGNIFVLMKNKKAALAEYETVKSLDRQMAQNLFDIIHSDKLLIIGYR